MFEDTAGPGPAGFHTAVTKQRAKLPAQLWHTGNDGFPAAMDALAVQVDLPGGA